MKSAKNHGKPWGERELQRLEKLGKTHTASEIAYILGRTVWAIQTQARQRGIRYVRKPQTSQGEQLCWRCYHATNPENVCPWVCRRADGEIRWEPVQGWTADEVIVNGEKAYAVRKCPLFREG